MLIYSHFCNEDKPQFTTTVEFVCSIFHLCQVQVEKVKAPHTVCHTLNVYDHIHIYTNVSLEGTF